MPHDFDLPEKLSEFKAGVTDDYALDTGADRARVSGLSCDATWGRTNANGAPLFGVVTVCEEMHVVPGTH